MAEEQVTAAAAATATLAIAYEDLEDTIKEFTEENGKQITYFLKITNPEKIVIDNVASSRRSIGKTISKYNRASIKYDLTATDLTRATVVSFTAAFKGCANITKIGALPVNYLENSEDMFADCTSLIDVDIDALSSVVDASRMFRNCFSLKAVSLGRVINIVEADEMFYNCFSLEKVDVTMLGKVDTSESMFGNCRSLVELTVSTEFLEDLRESKNMLSGCTSLKRVKADNPAYIDRSTIIRGDLDVDAYLTVSNTSEKAGATVHGDLIADNLISHNTLTVGKAYIDEIHLSNADEKIHFSDALSFGEKQFLFKQDPLEFTADDNVKWVAQSKLGEISAEKTILLLFPYSEANLSSISGQLRVASQVANSNFNISLSSEGHYTFFSNSGTKNLSANIVLCSYNNTKYFGLAFSNFMDKSSYEVYYSGFFSLLTDFIDYQTYEDKDLYVINEYPYGSTDKLNFKEVKVTPMLGLPPMNVCINFGTITASRTVVLLCKKSEISTGAIGGQLYEFGDGINSMYHFSLASNGKRFLSGASSFNSNATFVECEYKSNIYYGIQFPSKIKTQLLFQGFDKRDTLILPPNNYIDSDLRVQKISNSFSEEISSTAVSKTISLDGTTTWDFTNLPSSFFNNSNNAGTDFGSGLTLVATIPTSIYPDAITNDNKGHIEISRSTTIFNLTLDSTCVIRIKFFSTAANQYLYIMSNGQMDSLVPTTDGLGECVLEYNDTIKTKHEVSICSMNTAAPICISSIEVKSETILATEINRLAFTDDGVPHKIKILGKFTKELLQTLAYCLVIPERLIHLDLSESTLDSNIINWDPLTGLNTIFNNCFSLASIKLPSNLHKMEGQIFYNCYSLKEIFFNDQLYEITGNGAGGDNGLFTKTSIRDVYIPYNIEIIGKNAFAHSDVESIIFAPSNKGLINKKDVLDAGSLANTSDDLTIKVTKEFYRQATYTYWWFSVNPGKVPNDIYTLYEE